MADKLVPGDSLNEEVFNKFNAMADEVNELKESGVGGGGSTNAIIDVDALPSDNINLSAIYRIHRIHPVDAHIVYNGGIDTLLGVTATVQAVDTLPEEGSIVIDVPNNKYNFYYQTSDGGLYGYVRTHLVGIEADGWMPFNELKTNFSWSFSYGGVISAIEEATAENTLYMLYNEHEPELYHYKNGWWKVGEAITDVDVLPTENIKENTIYRVKEIKAYAAIAGQINSINGCPAYINVVDTLPATGEYIMDDFNSPTRMVAYYQVSDNTGYCWVPGGLVGATDMWMPLGDFLTMMGVPYGGVVTSLEDAQGLDLYILLESNLKLYHYKDGWHKIGVESEDNKGVVETVTDIESITEQQIINLYNAFSQGKNAVIRLYGYHESIGVIEQLFPVVGGVYAVDNYTIMLMGENATKLYWYNIRLSSKGEITKQTIKFASIEE